MTGARIGLEARAPCLVTATSICLTASGEMYASAGPK